MKAKIHLIGFEVCLGLGLGVRILYVIFEWKWKVIWSVVQYSGAFNCKKGFHMCEIHLCCLLCIVAVERKELGVAICERIAEWNHKMWFQNYFDTLCNKTVTSSASLSYFGNVIFPLFGPLFQVLREWFATIRAPLCTWFNKEGVKGQLISKGLFGVIVLTKKTMNCF